MSEGGSATPTFSVVIPVFNRGSELIPTLRSVQQQTFADFECLVIDDGSTNGDEIASVVAGLNDPRFRYTRRCNGGGGAARNTGVEESRGRYIAFLDSDDYFLPRKLEVAIEFLTDDPLRVVYSKARVDRGVGKYWVRPSRPLGPEEDVGEYLFVRNEFIPTPTIVLHREMALHVKWDPNLRKGQDLDFTLRLQREGARFFMIEEPLVVWNDISEAGRASRTSGHEAPLKWLERSRHLLTRKAYLGYRATVLAYYLAGDHPMRTAKDLFVGCAVAGVSWKVTLRQIARAYLPRNTYRSLVNRFVAARGKGENRT